MRWAGLPALSWVLCLLGIASCAFALVFDSLWPTGVGLALVAAGVVVAALSFGGGA